MSGAAPDEKRDIVSMSVMLCTIMFIVSCVFAYRVYFPNHHEFPTEQIVNNVNQGTSSEWHYGLFGITPTERRTVLRKMIDIVKVNEDDNKIDHPSGDIETPTNECVAEDDHSPSKTVCAMDTDITCVICLAEYEKGDETCTGQHCVHRYHTNCLYQWLEQHTRCPVCRDEIVTDAEFQVAASKLMDRKRFNELIAPKRVQEAMTLTRT